MTDAELTEAERVLNDLCALAYVLADMLEDMTTQMHATSPLVSMPPVSESIPAQAAVVLRKLADAALTPDSPEKDKHEKLKKEGG